MTILKNLLRIKKNAPKGDKSAVLKRQQVTPRGELFIDSKSTQILFQNPEIHKEIF